jgi:hypothetical protein
MGFYERVNIGAWLLWMAVLAVVLWRRLDAEGAGAARPDGARSRTPGAV